MRIVFVLFVGIFSLLGAIGCGGFRSEGSSCVDCHRGLEKTSASHGDCAACHGGNPTVTVKDISHRGMLGGKNPSSPQVWEKTCGRCHAYQLARVRTTIMTTNTGMIRNIQRSWEGEDGKLYATRPQETFAADGSPLRLENVEDLNNLSGELYRKFCSLCHVATESNQVWTGSHGAGCAACHFPYNDNATYQGRDQTVKGKWPYSASHEMAALPNNEVCFRCHNRSGRIALSYQGLNDGNNGLVPTDGGNPGPKLIGGLRNVTSIAPDIHYEKGMECIDCHTSRDVMGDGYAYRNMYLQTEIRCEDCHGSPTQKPRHQQVMVENAEPVRESRSYRRQVLLGDEMVLTGKGRQYSNVFFEKGIVLVIGKRDGRIHLSKVITGTPEHTIAGHERLECYSCHSRAVPQCFGCHTKYDLTERSRDYVKGRDTPGAFSETEDYRMLYPFPLALDQRGRVSPVTPGCQTFVTVVGPNGKEQLDEHVFRYNGEPRLRFVPFYSHNTGTRAVGCRECHANPAFLGFGQHVVDDSGIQATLLCERSRDKPLDGFLAMKDGRVKAFSVITRENSRPLSSSEIKRILAVNLCLVCHEDGSDPIYQKEIDYHALDDRLLRPAAVYH